MSASIKQRMGGSKIGEMSNKELTKLLQAAQADLAAIRTAVSAAVTDATAVQNTLNALIVDVAGVSNNTGSANNTYQLTATAPTLTGTTAVAALTLTA